MHYKKIISFVLYFCFSFSQNLLAEEPTLTVKPLAHNKMEVTLPPQEDPESWTYTKHLFNSINSRDLMGMDPESLESFLLEPRNFYKSRMKSLFKKITVKNRKMVFSDVKTRKIYFLKNHESHYLIYINKVPNPRDPLDYRVIQVEKVLKLTPQNMPVYFAVLTDEPYIQAYKAEEFPDSYGAPSISKIKNSIRSFQSASRCGGFFVSNEGHFLTAFHCLANILKSLDLAEIKYTGSFPGIRKSGGIRNQNKEFRNVELIDYSHPKRSYKVYSSRLAGVNNSKVAKLIGLGGGWDPNHTSLSQREVYNGDWALLKYDVQSDDCISTNDIVTEGERAFAFGYPRRSLITGNNLQGKPLFVSVGEVVSNFQSQYPFIMLKGNEFAFSVYDRAVTSARFRMVGFAAKGMSGGPVLNNNFEAIGLTTLILPLAYNIVSEAMMPLRISEIKSQLAQQLGSSALNEVFDCQP